MRRWRHAAAALLWVGSAAATEVHRCIDARGGIVFQDAPCGTRGPGVVDQVIPEAIRQRRAAPVWIGPRRLRNGECLIVSPVLPLLWPEADGTLAPLPDVEGGLRLQLRAAGSDIAFAVLLRARRTDLTTPPAELTRPLPPDFVGPPTPAAPAPIDPARLLLSTRLDAHALIIDGGPRLTADNWRSPWALSFGERRSLQIRRAIQKGGALRLQVDLDGYGTLGSAPLDADALTQAMSAALNCSRG
jgi:hypothetical protein